MAARTDDQLIDINLVNGQDFLLDTFNDLSTVQGNTAIIYGLIRRLLVQRGTWQYDINFGSELYTLLKTKATRQISDDEIRDIVFDAAAPMLFDGRIDDISSVKITSRDRSTITIEIVARIGSDILTTTLSTPAV